MGEGYAPLFVQTWIDGLCPIHFNSTWNKEQESGSRLSYRVSTSSMVLEKKMWKFYNHNDKIRPEKPT